MTGRKLLAGIFVLLGSLAVMVAVPAIWATQQLRSEAYVRTAGPLIDDPAIQEAIASQVIASIEDQVDVSGVVEGTVDSLSAVGIPESLVREQLGDVLEPTEAALLALIEKDVRETLDSQAASDVWTSMLRDAGTAITSGAPSEMGVTVDLAPVVEEAKRRLVEHGFEAARTVEIQPSAVTITVIEPRVLAEAQRWYDVIALFSAILPALAGVAFLGALLAWPRWRTFGTIALGTAGAMGVVALVVALARNPVLAMLPGDQRVYGEATYDAFAASLWTVVWWVFGIALALAFLVIASTDRSQPGRRL